MAKRLEINSGDKFGRLTIMEETEPIYWGKYKHRRFLCICECGKETTVKLEYLRSGHTKSCGCNRSIAQIKSHKTHGYTHKRLYRTWGDMLNRCRNKKVRQYKDYGGRGIKVCDEWIKFENFKEWALNNGYTDNLTIDRKNVNGNYEPDNCKWATMVEQANNKRSNHIITYNNKTQTLKQWCNELNLYHKTIESRIYSYNWSIEKAFTTPIRKARVKND